MSNTPNPKGRRLRPRVNRHRIYRDRAGNVHIPGGYLPKEAYAAMQRTHPQLPLYSSISREN